MSNPLSLERFSSSFLRLDPERVEYVDIGGHTPLPVRAQPVREAKALLILFHGAIDRETRQLPAYFPFRRRVHPHAHQISLSDPTLGLFDGVSNGWFAGSEGNPLQVLLPALVNELVERYQIEKVVFAGGSGGGFAALYYSWHFPGSTAIASSPQTNILGYYKGHWSAYLDVAWPNRDAQAHELYRPCLDLREIYKQGMTNTAVYLQSSLDDFHLRSQMFPFLNCLPPAAIKNVAIDCSFWGKVGHSGSVPTTVMDAWIRASLTAAENSAESIVTSHHNATADSTATVNEAHKASVAVKQHPGYDPRDIELAARLTEELLRGGTVEHG